jgi:hypothetical protein
VALWAASLVVAAASMSPAQQRVNRWVPASGPVQLLVLTVAAADLDLGARRQARQRAAAAAAHHEAQPAALSRAVLAR